MFSAISKTIMVYSDDTVIKALQNGNEKAYGWIYNKYHHSLCLYARKIVVCIQTAEDIVHDFFETLWRDREKILIVKSLQAYLYKGVYNRCLKHLAHNEVEHKYAQNIIDKSATSLIKENNDPLSILLSQEMQREIEKAIEDLPEQCRKIFRLRIEGLSYQKIAEKLEITDGTVRKQINIARGKLLEFFL